MLRFSGRHQMSSTKRIGMATMPLRLGRRVVAGFLEEATEERAPFASQRHAAQGLRKAVTCLPELVEPGQLRVPRLLSDAVEISEEGGDLRAGKDRR